MTLRDYFAVLRRRWLTVASCALVGMLLALGITALMPKTYTAQATNFVSITESGGSTGDSSQLYQNSQYALGIVSSYTALASSPKLLQNVIDELGLDMTPRELSKHVVANNPTNTVQLVVTADSRSPQKAADIANAVSAQLAVQIPTLTAKPGTDQSPVQVTSFGDASVPLAPSSPRPKLNLALGLLLGLAVGAGVAVLRNQLDTTIKTTADLTDLTGATPLGTVRFDPALNASPLVAVDPSRPGVEDFRSIRTSLRFVDVDHSPQLIVISSAIANEGKSVTSCNLAIILAQAGLKVCLVEGDLRLPKATAYLGVDGSVGLSDVVAGHLTLDEALITWGSSSVTVLAAGTTPPDPNNLLGTAATRRVFDDLRERFDMIIVDAPPLLPVSDAAILASFSDGVILVARHGHVHADQFEHALDGLSSAGLRVLGTVLTQVPLKHHRSRYGYGYASSYGSPATSGDLVMPLDDESLTSASDRPDDDAEPMTGVDESPDADSSSDPRPSGKPPASRPRQHRPTASTDGAESDRDADDAGPESATGNGETPPHDDVDTEHEALIRSGTRTTGAVPVKPSASKQRGRSRK